MRHRRGVIPLAAAMTLAACTSAGTTQPARGAPDRATDRAAAPETPPAQSPPADTGDPDATTPTPAAAITSPSERAAVRYVTSAWRPTDGGVFHPAPAITLGGRLIRVPLPASPGSWTAMTLDGTAVAADLDGALHLITADGTRNTVELGFTVVPVAVTDGAVALAGSQFLLAVSTTDGRPVWASRHWRGGMFGGRAVHGRTIYSVNNRTLTAISLVDGSLLWEVPLTSQTISGNGPFVAATDERVIVADYDMLYGFRADDGLAVWEVGPWDLARTSEFDVIPPFGQPSTDGIDVVVAAETSLLSFDADDGSLRWHVHVADPPRFGMAALGPFLYYGVGEQLTARYVSDGSVAWRASLPGRVGTTAPVVAGGNIVVLAAVPAARHELAYDTAVVVFDWTGRELNRRVVPGALSWQVAVGPGIAAVGVEISRSGDTVGPWEVVILHD